MFADERLSLLANMLLTAAFSGLLKPCVPCTMAIGPEMAAYNRGSVSRPLTHNRRDEDVLFSVVKTTPLNVMELG